MEPLKGICHNKMHTVVGYTINQINCDDNGAYGDTRSVKKDYYVQEEYGKLILILYITKAINKYSILEIGDPTINFLLNRPNCTLLKDIIKEIKAFLVSDTWLCKLKMLIKCAMKISFVLFTVMINLPLMITHCCLMTIRQKQIILKLEHHKQF